MSSLTNAHLQQLRHLMTSLRYRTGYGGDILYRPTLKPAECRLIRRWLTKNFGRVEVIRQCPVTQPAVFRIWVRK